MIRALFAPTKISSVSSHVPVPAVPKPVPIWTGAPKLSPLLVEVQIQVRSVIPDGQFQQPATITTLPAAGVKTTGRPVVWASVEVEKLSDSVRLQELPPAVTRQ